MAKEKKTNLRLVRPPDSDRLKKEAIRRKSPKMKRVLPRAALVAMLLLGTWLLLMNHCYHTVYRTASYKKETSDSNRYAPFQNGIVRYSRDGVTYLNYRNEALWVQSGQFKNPLIEVNEQSFAVADVGGNSIQVFTEEGLKGEIGTNLPIEKFSISNQGIVSTILKNENTPMIVVYDATGNILVENQVVSGNAGYPVALDLSPSGETLMVSYLDTKGGVLKSKVVCYNFGEAGKKQENYQVSVEEYEDSVMPEIFFMDDTTSVVVGDHSFVIYEGEETPQKKTEIQILQEIKSTFYNGRYIGFILLNEEKSGYELRLYDKSGEQTMSRAFTGEYTNVQMRGNEIIMYEGTRCSIYTNTGMPRFEGNLKEDILLMIPVDGINKYLVMNAAELQVIYLAG